MDRHHLSNSKEINRGATPVMDCAVLSEVSIYVCAGALIQLMGGGIVCTPIPQACNVFDLEQCL